MKLTILIAALIVSTLFACESKQSEPKSPAVDHSAAHQAAKPKMDFSKVTFASTKDLACGMPLTAGLEDTAHYEGKIYGFCSKECKADFVKNAKTYVADKK